MEKEKSYGLEEVHKELLITLDAFDKICREHDIHYSLHGGTLIGAERNHKMIPWDDDVDISISRMNYIKLEKALEDPECHCSLNKDVLWVPRFTTEMNAQPVCIDILIWDYVSDNKLIRTLKVNLLRALQGMMKTEVDYSRFGLGARLLLAVTSLFGKLFPNKLKCDMYTYVSSHCFLGNRRAVHRSNDNFRGLNQPMDSDYIKSYTTILLENKRYMVSKRYHELLVMCYGADYMTPPPENERIPQHANIRNSL